MTPEEKGMPQHLQFEGNREQFSHERNVLAGLENTEIHLNNMEWEKAKEAVNKR